MERKVFDSKVLVSVQADSPTFSLRHPDEQDAQRTGRAAPREVSALTVDVPG